jgi:hypothetical protein
MEDVVHVLMGLRRVFRKEFISLIWRVVRRSKGRTVLREMVIIGLSIGGRREQNGDIQ